MCKVAVVCVASGQFTTFSTPEPSSLLVPLFPTVGLTRGLGQNKHGA